MGHVLNGISPEPPPHSTTCMVWISYPRIKYLQMEMAVATKREQLEELDSLVLAAMTKALASDDTDALQNLNVVVSYLKSNQVITPPAKESTAHDKIKDAIR